MHTQHYDYTICIDGGGSKTLLQVLDSKGNEIPVCLGGTQTNSVISGPSNINTVTAEGVREALKGLFEGLALGPNKEEYKKALPRTKILAGIAGIGDPKNKEAVKAIFEEFGIKSNLTLLTDAEVSIQALGKRGIILIAGTGSICMAKKNNDSALIKVGGLGPALGDEGSGYDIGKRAVVAAIEYERLLGRATKLTEAVKTFFKVDQAAKLIAPINSREIATTKIAAFSPEVFRIAYDKDGDKVAQDILSQVGTHLARMVTTAAKTADLSNCELHLWGGVFKTKNAEEITKKIEEAAKPFDITVINQSDKNATVVLTKSMLQNEKN